MRILFDPTVFDNLKVVLEGAVYELDLNQDVEIVDRCDLIDLAKMSRTYQISLAKSKVEGSIELATDVQSWSSEILENGQVFPCELYIQFYLKLMDTAHDCPGIRFKLNQIWRSYKPKIEQQISFIYGNNQPDVYNQINLYFQEAIDESFIADIPNIINRFLETLDALETFAG